MMIGMSLRRMDGFTFLKILRSDQWLIYQSTSVDDPGDVIEVCPRAGKEPPEKYRAALAEAEELRSREHKARWEAAAAQRASEKSARGKWCSSGSDVGG
jgi:hypothetical protein